MKKWTLILLLTGMLCLLAGCSQQTAEEEEGGYQIWYISQNDTSLGYERKEVAEGTAEEMTESFLELLRTPPSDEGLKSPFPESVKVEGIQLEQNQLYLDLSMEYLELVGTYEVLCRAAIVKTLSQVPGVEYVGFRVADQPILHADGSAVGLMTADQFIESAGERPATYQTAELTLYYANETGDKLVPMYVTLEVSQSLRSSSVSPEQPENILLMLVTLEVSQALKSSSVRPEQLENMLPMCVTLEVLKASGRVSVSRLEQPENIKLMSVTLEVSKFSPRMRVSRPEQSTNM